MLLFTTDFCEAVTNPVFDGLMNTFSDVNWDLPTLQDFEQQYQTFLKNLLASVFVFQI